MAGLSRRAFLATTTALAGSFALPNDLLARSLAAPLTPSGAPSTLQQTIRLSQTANQQYRNLVAAPGEPYIVRTDLLDNNQTRSVRRAQILGLPWPFQRHSHRRRSESWAVLNRSLRWLPASSTPRARKTR